MLSESWIGRQGVSRGAGLCNIADANMDFDDGFFYIKSEIPLLLSLGIQWITISFGEGYFGERGKGGEARKES